MVITSKENKTIKEIKKLKEKKYRKEKFIIEGEKMINEAIQENMKIEAIVVSGSLDDFCKKSENREFIKLLNNYKFDDENKNQNNKKEKENESQNNKTEKENESQNNKTEKENKIKIENQNNIENKIYEVSESIFKELTDVKTPQGILAVVRKNIEDKKIDYNANFILALDGLQDPGNIGTIIRTLDAANIKQIIVSKETVDCYSPKVIRSTMGSIFRVNVIEVDDLKRFFDEAEKQNFEVVSTALDATKSIYNINYNKKIVVIGNEANGVSKDVQNASDLKVKIPMPGKAESLNASVAASIMIYEYVRQSL